MLSVAGAGAWLATQPLPGDDAPTSAVASDDLTGAPIDPSRGGEGAAESAPEPTPVARLLIELRSHPSGAEVFVDERSYGSTPAVVEFVGAQATQGREVSFRFELPGHRSTVVTRTIEGERVEVDATLPSIVRARPRPRPSQLSDDDRPVVTDEAYRDNPY
jgi:hypothetical protein